MAMTTAASTPTLVDAAWLADRLSGPDAPRVLDVRTPGEFHTAHIDGSYNVPLDTLREHRDEIARRLDEDVVLICRSGNRAGQAGEALAHADLPNLHVLNGGILAWEAAGHAVRRGEDPRWELERQVRLVAGSIVLASTVLSRLVDRRFGYVAGGIGAGLTFAAVSDTCAMGALLSKLPYNRRGGCDPQELIDALG